MNAWIHGRNASVEKAESKRQVQRDAKSKLKEHSGMREVGKLAEPWTRLRARFIVRKVRGPEPTAGNN